jgi:hypothetical protein
MGSLCLIIFNPLVMSEIERRQNRLDITNELSEMKVDIRYIQRDITDIKQSIRDGGGVYALNKDMLEIIELNRDHERRIRILERYGTVAITLLALAQVIAPYILKNIFS